MEVLTPMTTNVENGVEFPGLGQNLRQLSGLGPEGLVLLQEFDRNSIIFECFNRSGIQRSFASTRGGDYQFGLIFQDLVRMGKLWLLFGVSKSPRT